MALAPSSIARGAALVSMVGALGNLGVLAAIAEWDIHRETVDGFVLAFAATTMISLLGGPFAVLFTVIDPARPRTLRWGLLGGLVTVGTVVLAGVAVVFAPFLLWM